MGEKMWAVFSLLMNSEECISAEDIQHQLEEKGYDIGLKAVYAVIKQINVFTSLMFGKEIIKAVRRFGYMIETGYFDEAQIQLLIDMVNYRQDLTNNDMHVIEAVGLGDGNNMSSIARKLNITVGSLTTAMNSLVNKRYVERHRSEEDRRVVLVKLTEKGVKAYHHHEDYHRQMTQAILDKLDDTELPVLVKTLDALSEFFTGYSENKES